MRCISFVIFLTFSSCFVVLPALENVTQADEIELLERQLEYQTQAATLRMEKLKLLKAKKELGLTPYDTVGNGFLLAEYGESVAGGVAFARLNDGVAEMARLFVRPDYRRGGIARDLVSRSLAEAAAAGHRRMVLHTLPQWHAARALYGTMAFEPIPAYDGVQVAEAACYARDTKLSGT